MNAKNSMNSKNAKNARRLIALGVFVMTALSCATAQRRSDSLGNPANDAENARAWEDARLGRDGDAVNRWSTVIKNDPGHRLARFGRASVAFEQGDVPAALTDNLVFLETLAASGAVTANGPGASAASATFALDPQTTALAAMAAGRLSMLLEEFGGNAASRHEAESRVLALALAPGWPWPVRHELAMVGDGIARGWNDVASLAKVAEAAGCVRDFHVTSAVGALPHLDLDARPTAPAGEGVAERSVRAVGCRVSLPSFAGRTGAQRVLLEWKVPSSQGNDAAQAFDVVLDFGNEARIRVDDGPAQKHGDEFSFGPRVSATRVSLTPGKHTFELRLATYGGRSEVTMMVVPVAAALDSAHSSVPVGQAWGAAAALANLYVANRHGDAEAVSNASPAIEEQSKFAIGRALLAAVRRDDPTVPLNVARDRGRALLQEALVLDAGLARPRHALAGLALDDDRPRVAIEEAKLAAKIAPRWWLPQLTLYGSYRLRGLAFEADRALDRALALGEGACSVVEAALGRAEDRRDHTSETRFSTQLDNCPSGLDERLERLRKRGDLAGAAAILRRMIQLAPDRDALKSDLAAVLLATGDAQSAVRDLSAIAEPRDGEAQVRLADAWVAAGQPDRARALIAGLLSRRPDLPDAIRAARSLALPLPLDAFRLNGHDVIRAFEASGARYQAPAVVVLDRTVTRVFADGSEMTLTHEIVRVQSKDAIEKWGEVSLPERAEILTVRTHKPDGTTREPEDVAGKESVSAADLGIGDYVEKETLEVRSPAEAFSRARGFLGDRFYFQSFDAPLDRSEYVVVTDGDGVEPLSVDARAGAPTGMAHRQADGLLVTTFARRGVAQLFPERASVPAIDIVPSVRLVRSAGWRDWARFLREQTYGTQRTSWGMRAAAEDIRRSAKGSTSLPAPKGLASALVSWVGQRIEDDDDLRESASFSVARGRGNRVAVLLTLSRLLGLHADVVLARSRLLTETMADTPISELDDFSDALVRFRFDANAAAPTTQPKGQAVASESVFCDPRLKHAPLGYLPPGLAGGRALVLDSDNGADGVFVVVPGVGTDERLVNLTLSLDARGGGTAEVEETLHGWPALEWAEIVDKFGADREKMRQDFEQRWLGVQFPGAVLKDLVVDVRDGLGQRVVEHRFPKNAEASRGSASPRAVGEIRLSYSFENARSAVAGPRELKLSPQFFRALPGRRYAAEPRRSTTLMMGFEVALDLNAQVFLPTGADVDVLGGGLSIDRPGGYRFSEGRRMESIAGGRRVLKLRRQTRMPILRVLPESYPQVAAQLRAAESAEQEEIHIKLAPTPRAIP